MELVLYFLISLFFNLFKVHQILKFEETNLEKGLLFYRNF